MQHKYLLRMEEIVRICGLHIFSPASLLKEKEQTENNVK